MLPAAAATRNHGRKLARGLPLYDHSVPCVYVGMNK